MGFCVVFNNCSVTCISRGPVYQTMWFLSLCDSALHLTLFLSNWLLFYIECYPICGRLTFEKGRYISVRVSAQPVLAMHSWSKSCRRNIYEAVSIWILRDRRCSICIIVTLRCVFLEHLISIHYLKCLIDFRFQIINHYTLLYTCLLDTWYIEHYMYVCIWFLFNIQKDIIVCLEV